MTQPLFCKPLPGMREEELLFLFADSDLDGKIAFRSLQLTTDIETIHDWVNRFYTKRFWQLNGSKSLLINTYKNILNNQNAHSFIGLFNNQPVCQIDIYAVSADELKEHIKYDTGDCGLHLLMCPPEQMIKGLSLAMLQHFIQFYFSFPAAQCLYAEPDKENVFANRLAIKSGFHVLKTIELAYKTANLYSITKQQFQQHAQ